MFEETSRGAVRLKMLVAVAVITGFTAPLAFAADDELETLYITAAKVRSLEQFTPTASRLGLSARETPATLDVIDADEILGRGFATAEQAVDSLPGVISGGAPGDMSSFSMRGFSEGQVMFLHNGLYVGPSNMTNRPVNAFNLASIEVLKGPASVLYGQGAIGGVVNVVNKGPDFGAKATEFLLSAGSFGTSSLGVGFGTHSDTVSVRADLSRTATDGYVNNAHADSNSLTASLLYRPSAKLDIQFTIDYLKDHPSTYFGTPLVSAAFASQPLTGVLRTRTGQTLDARTRYVNYNVADALIDSEQYWPQVFIKYSPNEHLTIQNFSYWFHADRRWINAEVYEFNPTTRLIDRDRFFVFHKQDLYGDQISATFTGPLGTLSNKLVVGLDYSHLDFLRRRGFPDGDSVNPFTPSPGLFGPLVERRSPTTWNDIALFFEDSLDVSAKLKLITGGRVDRLDLDRKNFNVAGAFQASSSFKRRFNSTTWRAGLVYHANDALTPYVSWSTGEDPVNNNIFLVNAGENFDLSHADQIEAGIKASLADGRGAVTASIYDIRRKNILSVLNSAGDVSNIGGQKSRGIETSLDWRLHDNWTLSGNVAYTDASYGRFVDPNYGINATGNQPPNVPKVTANLWTSVSRVGGTPLELGGGLRYVGERQANTANNVQLQSFVLADLYAGYRLRTGLVLTGRVNNLFNKAYAKWADIFYPTEVILGAPRSFELSLVGRF
jgi:iron complex outermembrane receptor protein